MVMDYIEGGDLRKYLLNNRLSFKDKFFQLQAIAGGLKEIHQEGLIHKDFHPGNILIDYVCYITDLGLCRPANEVDENKIYGVIPYMAPEVLRGGVYTQASDIYSFGIVAYELFTNSYPYPKMDDMILTLEVCDKLRPNIDKFLLPQLLKDLIKRC
jgi:serine/threonine protein kinase